MKKTLSKILEEALNLPAVARAAMVDALIESLNEENDPNLKAAWAEEILRRAQKLDSRKVKTISALEYEPSELPAFPQFASGALALEPDKYVPSIVCFDKDSFLFLLARATEPLESLEAAEEAEEDLLEASHRRSWTGAAFAKKLAALGYKRMNGANNQDVKLLKDLLSADEFDERHGGSLEDAAELQIEENDPPETRQALDRMLQMGYSREQAIDKIVGAMFQESISCEVEAGEVNDERYARLLNALPQRLSLEELSPVFAELESSLAPPARAVQAREISPVSLSALVKAMQLSAHFITYVSTQTGEIVTFSRPLHQRAKKRPHRKYDSKFDPRLLARARAAIASPDWLDTDWRRWVEITARFEFCCSFESKPIQEQLRSTLEIRGMAGLLQFRRLVRRENVEEEWFHFREGFMRRRTIDWLKSKKMPYTEDL